MQKKTPPSFYRRPLPQGLVSFSSPEGTQIFKEALLDGTMSQFFPLIEQFHTQQEPAYCGLGTLSMVLNSLALDPNRQWKGPWRWFSEELLDCCVPLETVKKNGITIDEFRCLAKCNGASCEVHYASDSSEEEFRTKLLDSITAFSHENPQFMVISFDRGTLGQTGTGHFSPIGGYHKEKDLVLVLDVARFKYPSYWVPLPLLFKSLLPIDTSSGRSRGYMILKKRSTIQTSSIFCRVHKGPEFSWKEYVDAFIQSLKTAWKGIKATECCSESQRSVMDQVFEKAYIAIKKLSSTMLTPYVAAASPNGTTAAAAAVSNINERITWDHLSPEHQSAIVQLFQEAVQTPIFKQLYKAYVKTEHPHDTTEYTPESVHGLVLQDETLTLLVLYTIYFLALPQSYLDECMDPSVSCQIQRFRLSEADMDVEKSKFKRLANEVNFIRSQLVSLDEYCNRCNAGGCSKPTIPTTGAPSCCQNQNH